MHVWLLFLAWTTAYGINRISESDLIAVNFVQAVEGRKLNGSTINEEEVDSEICCRRKCVKDKRCLSYNFGRTSNKSGRFKCQLGDSDRFVGIANFTRDENFKYVGIQNACETDHSSCGEKGVCIPDYNDDSITCKCAGGYAGKPCKPKHCAQLFQDGSTSSGVYTINPDGSKPIQVLCDMITDGGGWTVFQRRVDGSVDFYRDWASYKSGFGNIDGEFWLGNDNLHRLASPDNVTMRVDLEDFVGNIRFAEYSTFQVADIADKYRLLIGGYNGNGTDSMAYHNGMRFSTKDNDNDLDKSSNPPEGSCAKRHKGGWWYNWCHHSNLNGRYLIGKFSTGAADGVTWEGFRGLGYSLKRTEMKLKPKYKYNDKS